MKRALVIGRRSNVLASKLMTPEDEGARCRAAAMPSATPVAPAAAIARAAPIARGATAASARASANGARQRSHPTSPRARTRCRSRTGSVPRDSSRGSGGRYARAAAGWRRPASSGGSCLRIAFIVSTVESPAERAVSRRASRKTRRRRRRCRCDGRRLRRAPAPATCSRRCPAPCPAIVTAHRGHGRLTPVGRDEPSRGRSRGSWRARRR